MSVYVAVYYPWFSNSDMIKSAKELKDEFGGYYQFVISMKEARYAVMLLKSNKKAVICLIFIAGSYLIYCLFRMWGYCEEIESLAYDVNRYIIYSDLSDEYKAVISEEEYKRFDDSMKISDIRRLSKYLNDINGNIVSMTAFTVQSDTTYRNVESILDNNEYMAVHTVYVGWDILKNKPYIKKWEIAIKRFDSIEMRWIDDG